MINDISDPNIPETGMQKTKSSHGDSDCCYTYCGTPGRPCMQGCENGRINDTWPAVQCVNQTISPRSACRPPSYSSGAHALTPSIWLRVALLRILPLMALARTIIHSCLVCYVNCARTLRACVKWKKRIVT